MKVMSTTCHLVFSRFNKEWRISQSSQVFHDPVKYQLAFQTKSKLDKLPAPAHSTPNEGDTSDQVGFWYMKTS